MVYPKVPFRITRVYSREQTNGIPGDLHWMLVAEDIDSLQSSSLDGINKTIPHHIKLLWDATGSGKDVEESSS
jgi:hypothetical protein